MSKRSQIQLDRERMWLEAINRGGDNVASVLRENPILTALAAIAVNWGLYKIGFWDARAVWTSEVIHHPAEIQHIPERGHWESGPVDMTVPDTTGPTSGTTAPTDTLPAPVYDPITGAPYAPVYNTKYQPGDVLVNETAAPGEIFLVDYIVTQEGQLSYMLTLGRNGYTFYLPVWKVDGEPTWRLK